jgi:hypothetical protein
MASCEELEDASWNFDVPGYNRSFLFSPIYTRPHIFGDCGEQLRVELIRLSINYRYLMGL